MTRLRAALVAILLTAAPAHAGFNWAGQVAADAEGLANDDAKKRLDAVVLLAGDDIALAEPYLMKVVATDPDLAVRHAAAQALGRGGAAAAVPLMTDWLNDIDPKTKAIAAEVLGDIGGPVAASALIRSLGDPDAIVRQQAVKALGRIGRRGGNVVIALIPRLEDDKADVKRETIDQLEQLGDRRAVIPIVARFSDSSPEVRKAAVKAVGKLGDASAVPALIRIATGDSNLDVRSFAVGALGNLGAVDALDTLTEMLKSGDEAFRSKVATALGQIAATPGSGTAGEDAMRTLVQNLALPAQQASAAMEALRLAGHAAVPALVAHLQGRLAGDPTRAVTLLAEIGDARATGALAGELERGRVPMPLVLRALGATRDPAALVPVLGALSHKDAAIRVAAMEALRPLLGTDARAGDVLIEHLTDDDLEVRILATEYLGILGVGAAAPKLTVLAGPGNPARLRLAAIDALGGIGNATRSPDASRALVDVLREGPADLHRAASTALAYIADPAALPALVTLARADHGPTRYHVVRAIGRTLRAHPDPTARRLLRELTGDNTIRVALAAIAGLAAAGDPAEAPPLRELTTHGAADRRRAAAWALGELHDTGGIDALLGVLGVQDDRVVGDATWALGEIAATAPADPVVAAHAGTLTERWLYLAQHGGWTSAIDATGALARTLWALPPAARAPLVAGPRRAELGKLAFHKSRLVRINAALALAALGAAGDADAQAALATLVHADASPHVRAAAAIGMARAGAAPDAVKAAVAGDVDPAVKAAAAAPPVAFAPRTEWRSFYMVDPTSDDALVRQEPYFLHTADGLVWASYTDARGELTSEHVPAGDEVPLAASREDEY